LVTRCVCVFVVIFNTNSTLICFPKHYYINRLFFVFECLCCVLGTELLWIIARSFILDTVKSSTLNSGSIHFSLKELFHQLRQLFGPETWQGKKGLHTFENTLRVLVNVTVRWGTCTEVHTYFALQRHFVGKLFLK
jgi:hypothetical protein